MSMFFGISSGTANTLFGNQNFNKTGNNVSGFSLSDYASIKNGTYKKVLNAYYDSDNKNKPNLTTTTAKDSTKLLKVLEEDASNLKATADALLVKGSSSPFNKIDLKDETGKVTKEFDKDLIYKKVSDFVDSYNSLIDNSSESNTTSVLRSVSSMVNNTKANKDNLIKMGITIDEDNLLSIDEKSFKESDINLVQSTFTGFGSFGYQASFTASKVDMALNIETNKASTYNNSGKYSYNYNAGGIYNSWF